MLYVYKSMLNPVQNKIRTLIIFSLALLMPASLFFSRTLLAFAMLGFVLAVFVHPEIRQLKKTIRQKPLLWSITLLCLVPLLSGLWSENTDHWLFIMQTKLPLLFFPLAFALPFGFSNRQWFALTVFFILLVFSGTIWSMLHYLPDTEAVHAGYLRSGTIQTPLENDHVRFSWIVSICILLCFYLAWQIRGQYKFVFYLLLFLAVWLVVFLHILAARTGLFSFYLFLLIAGGMLIKRNLQRKTGWLLLLCLLALPLIAYFTLPTFHNRVHYFLYDLGFIRNEQYLRQSNDGNRVLSYKAGLAVFASQPLRGVGFGDIRDQTHAWYAAHYPDLSLNEKIDPSSEYLLYAAGSGWPGLLVFIAVICYPFFLRIPERLPWLMIHAGLAAGFFFDIGLELQFGVFLYLFVVLGWWKWTEAKKNEYLQRHAAPVNHHHLQK